MSVFRATKENAMGAWMGYCKLRLGVGTGNGVAIAGVRLFQQNMRWGLFMVHGFVLSVGDSPPLHR